MTATTHVVGAGLAGLAAALALTAAGRAVTVHESGPAAGGRCRSYADRDLGLTIDNGNHLLLSGNRAALGYLDAIGARDRMTGPARPCFPFMDLGTGARWTVRPSPGRVPWWLLHPSRHVPGTRARDFLPLLGLARITDDRSVAAALPDNAVFRRLVAPLAIAALNTAPQEGLARLLGAVVRETLLAGGAACRPLLPRTSLAAALVDPALDTLRARGADIRFGRRIAALTIEAGRVAALRAADGPVPLGPADAVVLAVPPWVAADLLPGLTAPDAFEAILNLHYAATADPGPAGFVGLTGGTAEWVFVKPGHVSVTVSAANRLVDRPAEELAAQVWPEVRAALRLHADAPLPPFRVVKEKRATFAATAAQDRRRPAPRTALANLVLAGDWTATGLPATIEGAIRSGNHAGTVLLQSGT
ncbi:MAG: hydroxysqualene dehydroxylase HpnE [Rhodospirillales bacterium]|nr:hydroxysqualene dehydroxylase HpnE [Rhodospirillales bacterium]